MYIYNVINFVYNVKMPLLDTCHGNSPWDAVVPPTILVWVDPINDVPQEAVNQSCYNY